VKNPRISVTYWQNITTAGSKQVLSLTRIRRPSTLPIVSYSMPYMASSVSTAPRDVSLAMVLLWGTSMPRVAVYRPNTLACSVTSTASVPSYRRMRITLPSSM
jgi:hypothetical protein